ncbi:sulfate reduction electron transfer complex DsrMKJOP subunit DsrO [Magnetospirillum fulvum]|uniref:Prokaryotic molybdopterin-containing oxidoreductase family, iron-sulfur binding subunit n=1 Tax=Magnetospirillum fulvum TaxID=1082 RepID=A0A1H6HWP1_MAGFU|nr:4Fe-4S dicluster domain-containing protein [Magnetospirillum fulvum]SEH40488.1 prokaryotic molybdopterin-containing oxidoreductase family, iron-sulfur binding subunit [Magnetospirillum fulvum]
MTPRRTFLVAALTGAGMATLAPGLLLIPAQAAAGADPARRFAILIDVTRCSADCTACVTACQAEQGWGPQGLGAADPHWVRKVEATDPTTGSTLSLPVLCQHCDNPPCVDVCPTGASFVRPDGIVLVDRHRCIGCRFCQMACPVKARSFVAAPQDDQRPHMPRGQGTVEACTLCVHRLDAGRQPACVEACGRDGGGAMLFGDLTDPDGPLVRALAARAASSLRADLGLGGRIRYAGL